MPLAWDIITAERGSWSVAGGVAQCSCPGRFSRDLLCHARLLKIRVVLFERVLSFRLILRNCQPMHNYKNLCTPLKAVWGSKEPIVLCSKNRVLYLSLAESGGH